MKAFCSVIFLTLFVLFTNCTQTNSSTLTNAEETETIVQKVYGWSNPELNGTNCNQVQRAAVALPKLLFLNDSEFVKAVPGECGDLGTCIRYYCGTYQMYSTDIVFKYKPHMVIHHLQSKNLKFPYLETVKADDDISRLMRQNCGKVPFFIENDVQAHLMMLKADTFENEISYLKRENIWKQLFTKTR